MDDLEISTQNLLECAKTLLIDPCPQTISEYEEAIQEMEVAMETMYSVGSNAMHVRYQDDE